MVALLSQEWLDLQRELEADLPARPGASARVQQLVTGGPDGDVAYVQELVDGRLVSSTLGAAAEGEVDVTIVQTFPDAVAIATGALDVHAAYMQGRVKVLGDMGALMRVLPVTQSPELRQAAARLAEQTDR